LSLLLLAALAAATAIAVGIPIINWDSFAMWGLKAKVLFQHPLTPRPGYFTDHALSFSHLDYPLLLPMLLAGAYGTIGHVDEHLGKIILPMLLAGQMLIGYCGARLWLGRLGALVVTVLLICAPMGMESCSIFTADMPLATFRLGSIVYLVRWIGNRRRCDLIVCSLSTVFAALTKNEGLALAAVNALMLMAFLASLLISNRNQRRQAFIDAAVFSSILLVGIGTWLAWRAGLPHTDENYPSLFSWSTFAGNANRFGIVLPSVARGMTQVSLWGALWIAVPILAASGYRAFARRQTMVLWAILILHLALYTLVYLIAPWNDVHLLLRDSLHRLLLHVAPTAAFLIAAHTATAMECPRKSAPQASLPVEEHILSGSS
jgi:hypothetical protein